MFRCENKKCNKITPPRQPCNSIVTEWRDKEYKCTFQRGRGRGEDFYTSGREIAKEIKVCPDCFREITGEEPNILIPLKPEVSEKTFKRRGWHDPNRQKRSSRKAPVVERVAKSHENQDQDKPRDQRRRDSRPYNRPR